MSTNLWPHRLLPPALLALAVMAMAGRAVTDVGFAMFVDPVALGSNDFSTVDCFTSYDTGILDPTAETADTGGDGDGFETNASGAFTDGDSFAENADGADDRHQYYDYGIAVPAGCAIEGIEVRLDAWELVGGSDGTLSVELSWDGGTSWTGAQTTAELDVTEGTFTLGGAADTWGRTWSPAELNDANFRVRITSNSTDAGQDFELDRAAVTAYYGP
jgi:hypothetical protein